MTDVVVNVVETPINVSMIENSITIDVLGAAGAGDAQSALAAQGYAEEAAASAAEASTYSGDVEAAKDAALIDIANAAGVLRNVTTRFSYAFADVDSRAPRVVSYQKSSGARAMNRVYARAIENRQGGVLTTFENLALAQRQNVLNFASHAIHIDTCGQSLGQAHVGGFNTYPGQIGKSFMWPYNTNSPLTSTLRAADPTDYMVTGANTAVLGGTIGENPTMGMLGHIFELAERENGMPSSAMGMTLISANNARGSTGISSHVLGQATFTLKTQQITSVKGWGLANGKPVVSLGEGWWQGETDCQNNVTKAAYKATMVQRAKDIATQTRLILTGTDEVSRDQTFDPHSVTYSTCSYFGKQVPFAQLEAAVDFYNGVGGAGPVGYSCPTYFMSTEYDTSGVHVPHIWTYMLGAYAGLYFKRVFLDEWDPAIGYNKRFPPMFIKKVRVIGNCAEVTIQRRDPRVALTWGVSSGKANFDGRGCPQQANYGIGLYDTGGATSLSILTPEIVAPDKILITRTSGAIGNGHRIGFGIDTAAVDAGYFKGMMTNLRDNYGQFARCERTQIEMHNWMPPQSATITDAANGTFTFN